MPLSIVGVSVRNDFFGLPNELFRLIFKYLTPADLVNLIYTNRSFVELISQNKSYIIRNFIRINPYESLFWSDFEGTMQQFISKLQALRISEPTNQTIQNLILTNNVLFDLNTIPEIRKFKLYCKMLLDTGMSIGKALSYTEDYVDDPRAMKILWTISKEFPDYVRHNENDETSFTFDMIEQLLTESEEEFNILLEDVDNLIEQTGAEQYEALEMILFYNQDEITQFIKNINNGFTSKIAFKLVKYEIVPDDESIARFNHFKTMFSPENSFKLLFESQDFNLPNGHVYTDAQIKLMLEYQLIYENNFVDHIQF